MAEAQGLSESTIRRIWRQHGLKPCLIETSRGSSDRPPVENLCDVVGLYLNPPDKSLVLCANAEGDLQTPERVPPNQSGGKDRLRARTVDYNESRITSLFAALKMLDGKVTGDSMPRHRDREFIRFLKKIDAETSPEANLQLIVDNDGSCNQPAVKFWLQRHPRFQLCLAPASSSWLSLVKHRLHEIINESIRRGSFERASALIRAITEYLFENDCQKPNVFVWSAEADGIVVKGAKHEETPETLNDRSSQFEHLIQEAARLFSEKGYHAASVRELAKNLSLHESTLYHYAPSKESLLYEICQRSMRGSLASVGSIIESDLTPEAKLRAFLIRHIEVVAEDLSLHTTMMREMRHLESALRVNVIRLRDQYEGMLREILEEGMKAGVIRPGSTKLIGLGLLGMANWMIEWYRSGGPYRPAEIAEIFFQMAWKGLQQGKEGPSAEVSAIPEDYMAAVRSTSR